MFVNYGVEKIDLRYFGVENGHFSSKQVRILIARRLSGFSFLDAHISNVQFQACYTMPSKEFSIEGAVVPGLLLCSK